MNYSPHFYTVFTQKGSKTTNLYKTVPLILKGFFDEK